MARAVVAGSVCSGSVRARPWWLVLADAVTAAQGANRCGGAGWAGSGLGLGREKKTYVNANSPSPFSLYKA